MGWASFFRKCKVCPKTRKGGRKATAKPGLHPLRLDNGLAKHVGKKAVDDEYEKSHGHENGAQQKKLQERFVRIGRNELRQEGEEEDGQFRVEDVQ